MREYSQTLEMKQRASFSASERASFEAGWEQYVYVCTSDDQPVPNFEKMSSTYTSTQSMAYEDSVGGSDMLTAVLPPCIEAGGSSRTLCGGDHMGSGMEWLN